MRCVASHTRNLVHNLSYRLSQWRCYSSLLAYRFNELSIGYFGYFVLYYFPIAIAITWKRNNTLTNAACIVIMGCCNLITGYRTILISSLILILVYNFDIVIGLPRSKKIIAISIFLVSFVAYEIYREA